MKNLIYNCCPFNWNQEWILNVKMLSKYASVFDGRKIIIIKTGDNLEKNIESHFDFLEDVEFAYVENNSLQEVAGFMDNFSKLESLDANEYTFYAHTKGVKYRNISNNMMNSIRTWRNTMYNECLSDINRIESVLSENTCCGCFLMPKEAPPLPLSSKWHFAGTFWWVNHAKLFSKPEWVNINQNPYGVEGYLGNFVPLNEAYNLLPNVDLNLYSMNGEFKCSKCDKLYIHKIRNTNEKLSGNRYRCKKCKIKLTFIQHTFKNEI